MSHHQFITFTVGAEEYGVDVMSIREITGWQAPTEMPDAPTWVRGVVDIRGEIIPILDLRSRFGGGLTQAGPRQVVIVVTCGGRPIGLLADAVADIVDVDDQAVRSVPAEARSGAGFISGLLSVEGRMIAVIALDHVVGTALFSAVPT